jgi:hypothetical protein
MKHLLATLIQGRKTSGSRDDVLRIMELIALEERESSQEGLKLVEKALKESDIHGDRRKEFSKALRIAKRKI